MLHFREIGLDEEATRPIEGPHRAAAPPGSPAAAVGPREAR